MVLSCNKISKSFGVNTILKDVSFIVENREKVALVGVNGAGKSTLFKIITGQLPPDSGQVIIGKSVDIGYLQQISDLDGELTIYENLISVFQHIIDMEAQLTELERDMETLTGDQLKICMDKYSNIRSNIEKEDGYQYKSRIRGILKGLNFTEAEADKKTYLLSGGERTRVSLGKLLLQKPELLLLDEPTNHLDIDSITWLEEFLKSYDGSVLIISHDRYFLDKVVTKVVEIENTKAVVYNGNFTDYSVKKEIDREIAMAHYINQQKEIKKQEEVIRTLRQFNREKSVKRANSREKLLAKMDVIDRPEPLPQNMNLSINPNIQSGFEVMEVKDVKKSFKDKPLFDGIGFQIFRGEKVALIGPNGIGKTTLVKIILGLTDYDSGEVKLGTNVNIGYYDQEHSNLNIYNNIFDEVASAYPKLTNLQVRSTLASFVFTGDDVFKKIETLSGGEKGRVALAKLILSKANFLILDEPTNHLDVFSKEILENAINNYTGTVLYISHDRYFINNTAEKIIEMKKDGVNIYDGNYDYYIEKRQIDTSSDEISKEPSMTEAKEVHVLDKKARAENKKRERDIIKIEKEISKTEEDIIKIEEDMLLKATDSSALGQLYKDKTALDEKLLQLYEKWEELNM